VTYSPKSRIIGYVTEFWRGKLLPSSVREIPMGQTRDFTFFTFLINDETFHQQLQDAVQVDLDDDSLPSLVSDSDDDIEESKGAAGHEWVEEDDGDGGVEEDDDDGGVEESKDHSCSGAPITTNSMRLLERALMSVIELEPSQAAGLVLGIPR
jgi:hypothetical protein